MTRQKQTLLGCYAVAGVLVLFALLYRPGLPDDLGSALASSTGNASATTRGDTASLPAEFALLRTRSPFRSAGSRGGPVGGPDATLVFKGVVQDGAAFVAFIEDVNAKNVLQVATGDAVGRGKVKSIDLDSIQYEVDGDSHRIQVGQNLNGETVQPTPTSKPSEPTPAAGPPGMPSGPRGGRGAMGPNGPMPAGPPPDATMQMQGG
jgi:hypothetical protein